MSVQQRSAFAVPQEVSGQQQLLLHLDASIYKCFVLHLEASVFKSLCCTCICAFVMSLEGVCLQEVLLHLDSPKGF